MNSNPINRTCVTAALLLLACSDGPTPAAPMLDHSSHGGIQPINLTVAETPEPFTVRAPLEPFRIMDNPAFMMHARQTADVVIQRLVFQPGAGPWHTHPGPSFVYVAQGSIKLDRFDPKKGCYDTPAFGAGQAYFEVADEVHRAVVLSSEPAVLLVTRFNIPPGAPITVPAADPGC
jgi:quercetin dioxygenase-like cupin family protein